MSSQETEIIETIRNEFPTKVDDKLSAILSCVNTEYKSATIGFFLDENLKTVDDIKGNAVSCINIGIRMPSKISFKSYCKRTFIPIGAVAEEKIKYKGRTNPVSHYRLTEDGQHYGKPIAQFALKEAVDKKISMYEIFGSIASHGETRSPHNTAKILFELDKEDRLREVDLENRTGLYAGLIGNHLLRLKSIGFIEYSSTNPEEMGYVKYEWIKEKNPEDVDRVKKVLGLELTKKIAHKMQQIGIADSEKLAEKLDYIKTENISRILSGLERQGFIKKLTEFKPYEKLSEASITKEGKEFVQEFLKPIHNALETDDFDAINKEIRIFDDRSITCNYARKAFRLYERVCPRYKSENKEDIKYKIKQLLGKGRLRKKEIDKKIGKNTSPYLSELSKEEIITNEKEGSASYYFLKK